MADWPSGIAMAIRKALGPVAASMDTSITGSRNPYVLKTYAFSIAKQGVHQFTDYNNET
jgi:hypothetical protein